jgi:hypothetical protein
MSTTGTDIDRRIGESGALIDAGGFAQRPITTEFTTWNSPTRLASTRCDRDMILEAAPAVFGPRAADRNVVIVAEEGEGVYVPCRLVGVATVASGRVAMIEEGLCFQFSLRRPVLRFVRLLCARAQRSRRTSDDPLESTAERRLRTIAEAMCRIVDRHPNASDPSRCEPHAELGQIPQRHHPVTARKRFAKTKREAPSRRRGHEPSSCARDLDASRREHARGMPYPEQSALRGSPRKNYWRRKAVGKT